MVPRPRQLRDRDLGGRGRGAHPGVRRCHRGAGSGGQEVGAPPDPTFFATPEEFERWLERNHASATELWVGFHRKATGRPSITWPEAVDVALCFGWIDGVRRSVDADSYANRFTPRKPTSNWSAVNVRKAEALIASGRMRPAGLAAFERRRDDRTGVYSYEQRHLARLSREQERRFRSNRPAWDFWTRNLLRTERWRRGGW